MRSGWVSAGGALLSAIVYGALFAPLELPGLAAIALVPFLWGLRGASSPRAAAAGALFGVCATASVAWWFPSMLQAFFGVSPAASVVALAGAGLAVDAAPYALFALWYAAHQRGRATNPLLVGGAWALAELARARGPLGNPLGLLGYAALDTPLAQLADLAGIFGISWLIAAVNAGLVELCAARRFSRTVALPALALALALGYGAVRERQAFGEGDPVRVALVQAGVARGRHWDRALRPRYLQQQLEQLRNLRRERPALVFLPEFGVDFYLREATEERALLERAVRELDAQVLTGGSHYRRAPDRTHYYNSVFLLDRSGRPLDRYDKLRLVPFAEYGPLGGFLRSDTAMYDPGKRPRVLHADVLPVGAFVCAEALFPEIARSLARAGAKLLANPSNDYWFVHPAAQEQQLQMARMRAIENRRWLARATATGVTALVDPHGRVRARSHTAGPELIVGEVRASSVETPYQRVGELGLALAFAWLILDAARARRPHGRAR